MNGLMAELDTMDTPMMASRIERNYKFHPEDSFGHLHCPTPGHGAPGVSQDLLSDELIHHVGQVGDDEDGQHSQGQVGGLHLSSGKVTSISSSWEIYSY